MAEWFVEDRRDWRKTLFPASFKGVPFEVNRDKERAAWHDRRHVQALA
jgi:prophage DNA circulation protein